MPTKPKPALQLEKHLRAHACLGGGPGGSPVQGFGASLEDPVPVDLDLAPPRGAPCLVE